jgi:hypothetical protein
MDIYFEIKKNVETNVCIYGDKVGSGKSIVMLSLIMINNDIIKKPIKNKNVKNMYNI